MATWPSTVDTQERARRLIDLFLVSVLLDAGAGTKWQYKSKESGKIYRRSEGLAVASLEMFKAGLFSSDPSEPCRVDSAGLKKLEVKTMARGLQVSEENPIDGLEGRTNLLIRLGDALLNQEIFGTTARPGNMLGAFVRVLGIWQTADHLCRLSPFSSFHPGVLRADCSSASLLESPHGRSRPNLACYADTD